MPEEREIPQEFIDWLYRTQGAEGVSRWYQMPPDAWQTSQTYLQWQETQPQIAVPEKFAVPDFPRYDEEEIEGILEGQGSLDELEQVLTSWLNSGDITQEEGDDLWDTYALRFASSFLPEGAMQDLSVFSSEEELADKINKLNLDAEIGGVLHDIILGKESAGEMALRASTGRTLAAQIEAQTEREELQYEGEVKRLQEQQALGPAIERLKRDPALERLNRTPEGMKQLSRIQGLWDIFQKEPYQEGLGREIARELSSISQGTQREAQRQDLIGQQDALIRRNMEEMRRAREAPANIPYPSGTPVLEKMLAGTGLGQGTRLRDFLQSEILSKAQEPAFQRLRSRWWEGISTPRGPNLYRSTAQQVGRGAIIADPTLSPEELRKRGLEGYPDPLYGLIKGDWKSRYFRRPGAGLARSLTPAVKFR